jgi:hypothetical protein
VQVLGSRLQNEPIETWQRVVADLQARATHAQAADQVSDILKICRLSYTALSLDAKQCFMTFAAYPEDARVPGEQLMQLWAALAAVPSTRGYRTAEKQLSELMDRCLVQRDPKGYYVHDVLRDVAVHEARDKSSGCIYESDQVRSRSEA